MPKPPRVSIIVVNWNGGAMLDECLQSAFAQTWTDTEVIVSDNASTDGSLERAEATWGPRLRVLRNPRVSPAATTSRSRSRPATGCSCSTTTR